MTKESTSTLREEDIYAAALSELELGATRPGLWAKAFAESEGDEPKSKALYIKLRVQQEKDRIQQEQKSAQTIAAEFAQRKAAAFSSVISQLNLQGYHTTNRGTGWIVREPLGGRVKLSSDDSLLEYAKGRVEVPTELLGPRRMNKQTNLKSDQSHSTTSSPTPSVVAFGNADNAGTASQREGPSGVGGMKWLAYVGWLVVWFFIHSFVFVPIIKGSGSAIVTMLAYALNAAILFGGFVVVTRQFAKKAS